MYLQRQAHQEVADAFAGSISQNLKALFTGTNVVTELLPLLNRVVAPNLKPVSWARSTGFAGPERKGPWLTRSAAETGQQPNRQNR